MDLEQFLEYCQKNEKNNNSIITEVNNKIDGRVCFSSWLHYLLSLKSYMGDTCKTYVEIGTLWGGSIACLLMLDNVKTEYVGIDLFTGFYGKECKKNDFNNTSINITGNNHLSHTSNNISKFNRNNNKITLIKGSSYDDTTVKKFADKYTNIDLLFIDGDHTEEGVIQDFMKYHTFVNPGGFILFDNYGQPNTWTGVKNGVDSINFPDYGFNIVGQLGYSLLINKILDI